MAKGIRGKLTNGHELKIIQWANDWFMVDMDIDVNGEAKTLASIIVSPLSIQLNKEEMDKWLEDPYGMEMEYALDLNTGLFKRR